MNSAVQTAVLHGVRVPGWKLEALVGQEGDRPEAGHFSTAKYWRQGVAQGTGRNT